jgi:hypothetical protein
VKNLEGSHSEQTHGGTDALDQLLKLDFELSPHSRRSGEENFHRFGDPVTEPRGTGYKEALGAARELLVEDQEWQTAKVIAMKVGDEDCINDIRFDRRLLKRGQRRCTAVEEARASVRLDEDTCVQATTATERVATSEKMDPHTPHDLSPPHGKIYSILFGRIAVRQWPSFGFD